MNSFTLSYSFSRQNARAEKKDINVRTRHDATLEDLKELIQPLEAVRDGINPKTAPGYITAACDSQYSTVKDPETGELKKARRNFFYRCDASVSKSSLAYLDIDNATPEQYAAAVQMVKRSRKAMCIYTTASHTDEAPRFRVVMPMARPVGRDDIVRVRYGLLEHFFKGYNVDASGFTLSQPMYLPPVNSMVTWSRRDTLIEPEELLEGIPEMKASAMSDYVVPEGEKSPLTDLFEEFAFEYGGVMTERGLKIPATPEHAENYSDPTPRPDDFLLCWPRDGYKVPNITMIHDTDIAATSGMTGRQKWEYVCEATGLPFDERFEAALGWGKRDAVEVSEEDLEDEPEAAPFLPSGAPVVENIMRSHEHGLIYGAPNCGKTMFIANLAYSVATGTPLFGKVKQFAADTTALRTKKGLVVCIAGEGTEQIKRDITANEKLHGGSVGDNFVYVEGVDLQDDKSLAAFKRKYHGAVMVLIDTFASVFHCEEENSASKVQPVMDIMKKMARDMGCAVLATHHSTKNGGSERGSGAIKGSVDFSIRLDTPVQGHPEMVNFTVEKNRGGGLRKDFTYGITSEAVCIKDKNAQSQYHDEMDAYFGTPTESDADPVGSMPHMRFSSPFDGYAVNHGWGEAFESTTGEDIIKQMAEEKKADSNEAVLQHVTDEPKNISTITKDCGKSRKTVQDVLKRCAHLVRVHHEDSTGKYYVRDGNPQGPRTDTPMSASEMNVVAAIEAKPHRIEGYAAAALGLPLSELKAAFNNGKVIHGTAPNGEPINNTFRLIRSISDRELIGVECDETEEDEE